MSDPDACDYVELRFCIITDTDLSDHHGLKSTESTLCQKLLVDRFPRHSDLRALLHPFSVDN